MKRSTLTVALLVVSACTGRHDDAVRRPPAPVETAPNLLTMTSGAAVMSRTGEAFLTRSPLRAIDGEASTGWFSPPSDPQQDLVYSLAAPALIQAIGFVTNPKSGSAATQVAAEGSIDGTTFRPLGTFSLTPGAGMQNFPVAPPATARYLRIHVLRADGPYASLFELQVRGRFTASPSAGPIDGCWMIEGSPARFDARGSSVSGFVGGTERTTLDGGIDGCLYRFAWIRGPEYGLAAMTVTPDGRHLGGIIWHEQAIAMDQFLANDWLGDREGSGCAPADGMTVFRDSIERLHYYPLFGLRFAADGTLDESASASILDRLAGLLTLNGALRARFTAHELRRASAAENLAVTVRQLDTLASALARRGVARNRILLRPSGQSKPRREGTSPLTRAMYSAVEIELAR